MLIVVVGVVGVDFVVVAVALGWPSDKIQRHRGRLESFRRVRRGRFENKHEHEHEHEHEQEHMSTCCVFACYCCCCTVITVAFSLSFLFFMSPSSYCVLCL